MGNLRERERERENGDSHENDGIVLPEKTMVVGWLVGWLASNISSKAEMK